MLFSHVQLVHALARYTIHPCGLVSGSGFSSTCVRLLFGAPCVSHLPWTKSLALTLLVYFVPTRRGVYVRYLSSWNPKHVRRSQTKRLMAPHRPEVCAYILPLFFSTPSRVFGHFLVPREVSIAAVLVASQPATCMKYPSRCGVVSCSRSAVYIYPSHSSRARKRRTSRRLYTLVREQAHSPLNTSKHLLALRTGITVIPDASVNPQYQTHSLLPPLPQYLRPQTCRRVVE